MVDLCKVPDCGRKVLGRGWCSPHYKRWRDGKDVNVLVARRGVVVPCVEEGCLRKHYAKGYCRAHYAHYFQVRKPMRDTMLRYKYGIGEEDYDRMLVAQDGHCALCPAVPENGRHLNVDHDHACCGPRVACPKCIRGLVCSKCNTGLHFMENAVWRDRAEGYLISPPYQGG